MAGSPTPKPKPKPKPKGSGKRTTVLAALLAIVGLVAMWLSDCIPGFGVGSDAGDSEGEAEPAEAAEPEAAKPEQPEPEQPPAKTLEVVISVHGCSVAGGEPLECEAMCEQAELFEGIDDAVLEVDGASHGSVVAVTDCLKSKGIDKVAIRRE
jgi:hypothetical protein